MCNDAVVTVADDVARVLGRLLEYIQENPRT